MGSQDLLPWCAARRCPATLEQGGCGGYILANHLNQTAQNFVACCEIQCGRSANVILGSKCGGATTATAISTVLYLALLLAAGGYMVTLGPFRLMKTITSWIIVIGSVIFTTGTGVFVTNVTSPFMVLQTVPAVGAMNVAIFSYFFSGFHYGVDAGYESAPLFAFITTAWTFGKELNVLRPADDIIRAGNGLAIAMLLISFTWIVHSISYRLYGYRVDWIVGYNSNIGEPTKPRYNLEIHQDPRFHMGAAQGHPTWSTPMGQSTSVIMTVLSWSLVDHVKKDFRDIQKCRPDSVFQTMLYGAPILITFTLVWNIISGMRCREVKGDIPDNTRSPGRFQETRRSIVTSADYPGLESYKRFRASIPWPEWIFPLEWSKYYISGWTEYYIEEYKNAVALQRMRRNTMFAEHVPDERLHLSDKIIGSGAWFLAQVGLVLSSPGFCSVWLVSKLLGRTVKLCVDCSPRCRWMSCLIRTEVTNADHLSAAKMIEECYVGQDLDKNKLTIDDWDDMFVVLNNSKNHRSINLNTFLDRTGSAELYNVLSLKGMSRHVVSTEYSTE